jgi:membrane protease YdiL (CAAX protease family)
MVLHLTKYHLSVLVIYLLIVPSLFFFISPALSYNSDLLGSGEVLSVMIVSLFCLAGFLFLSGAHRPTFTLKNIILIIFYALVFAVPEEIIFRGVIQGFFQAHLTLTLSVLISSFFFGFAHLFNGAEGFYPRNWNWKLIALAGIAGIPLGILFAMTGSLFASTLLHVLFLIGLQLFTKDTSTFVDTTKVLN